MSPASKLLAVRKVLACSVASVAGLDLDGCRAVDVVVVTSVRPGLVLVLIAVVLRLTPALRVDLGLT